MTRISLTLVSEAFLYCRGQRKRGVSGWRGYKDLYDYVTVAVTKFPWHPDAVHPKLCHRDAHAKTTTYQTQLPANIDIPTYTHTRLPLTHNDIPGVLLAQQPRAILPPSNLALTSLA